MNSCVYLVNLSFFILILLLLFLSFFPQNCGFKVVVVVVVVVCLLFHIKTKKKYMKIFEYRREFHLYDYDDYYDYYYILECFRQLFPNNDDLEFSDDYYYY